MALHSMDVTNDFLLLNLKVIAYISFKISIVCMCIAIVGWEAFVYSCLYM